MAMGIKLKDQCVISTQSTSWLWVPWIWTLVFMFTGQGLYSLSHLHNCLNHFYEHFSAHEVILTPWTALLFPWISFLWQKKKSAHLRLRYSTYPTKITQDILPILMSSVPQYTAKSWNCSFIIPRARRLQRYIFGRSL